MLGGWQGSHASLPVLITSPRIYRLSTNDFAINQSRPAPCAKNTHQIRPMALRVEDHEDGHAIQNPCNTSLGGGAVSRFRWPRDKLAPCKDMLDCADMSFLRPPRGHRGCVSASGLREHAVCAGKMNRIPSFSPLVSLAAILFLGSALFAQQSQGNNSGSEGQNSNTWDCSDPLLASSSQCANQSSEETNPMYGVQTRVPSEGSFSNQPQVSHSVPTRTLSRSRRALPRAMHNSHPNHCARNRSRNSRNSPRPPRDRFSPSLEQISSRMFPPRSLRST